MAVDMKILKKGDEVLNVWSNGANICVAIKQKNGEVRIYSIAPDENGIMRINKDDSLTITFGDGQIQSSISVTAHEGDKETERQTNNNTVEVIAF